MDAKLRQAGDLLVDALGRQSAFWGLGRTAGEMYAVLCLASDPVCLEEIAQRLGVTKGNISIAIRQLEQLAMVRRSWRRGDRRVFFVAETDFWKIAHSVLGLRQKPEFGESFKLVTESARLATEAEPSSEKDVALERLGALQDFYQALDTMVEAALAMNPEQMKALAEMFSAFKSQVVGEERKGEQGDETHRA